MTILATLCHIRKDGKLLLQRKARGLFGAGKYNAPGGKLKSDERPEQGAIREVLEETGLNVNSLISHGKLIFYFGKIEKKAVEKKKERPEPDWIVYVFSTAEFSGKLKSDVEGELVWMDEAKIPFEDMWQDDRHWLPLLLESKKFEGTFHFDEDAKNLLSHEIKIID